LIEEGRDSTDSKKPILREAKNICTLGKIMGLDRLVTLCHEIENCINESALPEALPRIKEIIEDLKALSDEYRPDKDPEPEEQIDRQTPGDRQIAAENLVTEPEHIEQLDLDTQQVIREELIELIEQIDLDFTRLEKESNDYDIINSVFRAVHTIKSTAGMGGLVKMKDLAHNMEYVLENVRSNIFTLDASMMDHLFEAIDLLKRLLSAWIHNTDVDIDISTSLEALARISRSPQTDPREKLDHEVTRTPQDLLTEIPQQAEPKRATTTEATVNVAPPTTDLKSSDVTLRVNLNKLDHLQNFIGELVINRSQLTRSTNIFEDEIEKLALFRLEMNHLLSDLTDEIQSGVISHREAKLIENFQSLTANINTLHHNFTEISETFKENTDHISFVSAKLQDGILVTRMVPISMMFNKFPRLIRDISRSTGKKAELVLSGTETELDKRLVEEVSDALIHLLRNSVDHGIETPEEREKLGKPATGKVQLRAYHAGNNIVIEVEDDGRGISEESIKRKAVEQGILSDEEIALLDSKSLLNLIFYPGFSTKEEVSELSGRGVGMDVVASKVARLKGTIVIDSTYGRGTRISIRLPLTLAIIQALIVGASDQAYALPLDLVNETLWADESQVVILGNREAIKVRNKVISLLRLQNLLNLPPSPDSQDGKFPVVMVGSPERQVGLVVDRLIGRDEFVIKSFNYPLRNIGLYSGATITGDGNAMLILNVPEISKLGMISTKSISEESKDILNGQD
jgi:two-component system, chemotaxis family, sensor kinase CheA